MSEKHEPHMSMIVAHDIYRAIGSEGDIPWFGNMKEDMRRFRQITMGTTVIMGRKTLESIGMALPKRRNIVVTRGEGVDIPSVEVARSIDEAYELSADDNTFILGGGEIYHQMLDRTNKVYVTEVSTVIENADAWFPELNDDEWEVTERVHLPSDDDNIHPYSFIDYERRS